MESADDEKRTQRLIAISNERAKLRANALDRMSTACLAIGVLGPTMGALYGTVTNIGPHGLLLAAGHVLWMCAAAVLHIMAHRALGRLR